MVYHYTTLETLYSILASYKESNDKEHFTFWASNALDQNDTEELSFSCEDLLEAILRVEKRIEEKGVSLSYKKISKAIDWGLFLGRDPKKVIDEINQHVKNREYTPYTLSFSHQEDKLLMWSIYANTGNGICLVFNQEELLSLKTKLITVCNDVQYDAENKDIKAFLGVIEGLYNCYLKEFKEDELTSTGEIHEEGTIYLKMMLDFVSPYIKNNAFEDENEWRIVLLNNPQADYYTRVTKNQNVIHYVKVGIPISALNNIIIGPCADYSKVVEQLIKVASDCGIKKMTSPDFYIKSRVPYRHY